jgi:hypothetical protein
MQPSQNQVQNQGQGQGQGQGGYGQGPSNSYNTNNAFSNSFAFGPQALSKAPAGKSEDEVRLAELALAGEKVGRGMAADEEISGDMADMMQNAQAASKFCPSPYTAQPRVVLMGRCTGLFGHTGPVDCLLSFPNHPNAPITR